MLTGFSRTSSKCLERPTMEKHKTCLENNFFIGHRYIASKRPVAREHESHMYLRVFLVFVLFCNQLRVHEKKPLESFSVAHDRCCLTNPKSSTTPPRAYHIYLCGMRLPVGSCTTAVVAACKISASALYGGAFVFRLIVCTLKSRRFLTSPERHGAGLLT